MSDHHRQGGNHTWITTFSLFLKSRRLLTQVLQVLPSAEAKQRLKTDGPNLLEVKKKKTILSILVSQLTDFMTLILIAAAVISGIVGDVTDTIVILAIVVINAIVGFIQEWRAEKAMEALENMAASHAKARRDNQAIDIPASDLVAGDVILLEAGDIIPADARFMETHALKVDESSLTGESVNIEKNTEPLPDGDYPLGDRINMGYKGTLCDQWPCRCICCRYGYENRIGTDRENDPNGRTQNTRFKKN